jgi:hypothetical protein
LPFWHTTVVVEPGGTTTVVFCGGGGLELLMQPASNPAAARALNSAFIIDSCSAKRSHVAGRIFRFGRQPGQERMTHANVLGILRTMALLLQEQARFENTAAAAAADAHTVVGA